LNLVEYEEKNECSKEDLIKDIANNISTGVGSISGENSDDDEESGDSRDDRSEDLEGRTIIIQHVATDVRDPSASYPEHDPSEPD
jgi:hypothetical protein